uniref:RNA-directed DNA polymerase n=1 Tax=Bos indicus x Bos taurus TaxID=30522 RepID=A0A4W2EZ98_BOBOX
MARMNTDILGISELKWTGMGEFNSDDSYISYCGQESLRRNGVAIMVNKRAHKAVLGGNLKNNRMISVHFQGKPFNITVIQVYALTSNAEEAEVEWFYEDLQDLLELTHKKDVIFIIGDWNGKVGSQETPGVTGKFGLGVQNEAGQRLTEFCFIDYAKAFDFVDHNKLWKILKEMGIPDHLTCLLRNLYAGQEAKVRNGHATTDSFQIGKGVRQGCILSPCLFNLYAEYIMRNCGRDEAQAGIKIVERNINSLRYADDTTLMAENKEELKNLMMKVKDKSEKIGLKLNIQKTKIMVSGPITSWQIDVKTVTDFILGGSKISADADCSHQIKRGLLLGRKVMTNLDSILKTRDITLPTKVQLVKGMVFPVVMYGCESLTIKKAEC